MLRFLVTFLLLLWLEMTTAPTSEIYSTARLSLRPVGEFTLASTCLLFFNTSLDDLDFAKVVAPPPAAVLSLLILPSAIVEALDASDELVLGCSRVN